MTQLTFAEAEYATKNRENARWIGASPCVPGRRAQLTQSSPTHWVEGLKASDRAKVEHPFLTVKRQIGYGKARYGDWRKTTIVCRCWRPSASC